MNDAVSDEGTASRRPGARELQRIRTRTAVIDAAIELFAQRGFDGTSLPAIAQASGVPVPLGDPARAGRGAFSADGPGPCEVSRLGNVLPANRAGARIQHCNRGRQSGCGLHRAAYRRLSATAVSERIHPRIGRLPGTERLLCQLRTSDGLRLLKPQICTWPHSPNLLARASPAAS